jgi:predicted phosphohydrolase
VIRQPRDSSDAPSQTITWLHLSDLHHGQAGEGGRWPSYRDVVLADMKEWSREHGPPDLILFTGDLSYSGKPEEFELVTRTLNEIRAAVGGDPIVVPVPGNHDLVWPRVPHGTFRHYLDDETLRQGFLKDPPDEDALQFLRKRFAAYLEWWEREIISSDWGKRGLKAARGLLPGDFCLTVPCNGLRLGLLGINSAWLQLEGGMGEHTLAVEIEQFSRAGIDVPRWAQEHDAALILMHHPPEWLEKKRAVDFRSLIYEPQRFVACLFGHMHEAESKDESTDGQRRLWLQASSLLGLEHYGEATRESRVCGYDWGRLERVSPEQGRLTRWKRRVAPASGHVIKPDRPHGEPEQRTFEVALRRSSHRSPDPMTAMVIPSPKQAWKGLALGQSEHVLAEAKRLFEAGNLHAAHAVAQAQVERWEQMDRAGRDEDYAGVLARLRLFEGICSLCLQDSASARARVSGIDEALLDEPGRVLLAQLLAQIGETARARAVLDGLDSEAAVAARQLVQVEEGTIPDPLADEPTLRLRAAMRAIERGRHEEAARWALRMHENAPDQPIITAGVVNCLLTALEWSVLDVPSGCTAIALELRPGIIKLLQEHLEPQQPSVIAAVVDEKHRALWSARFHRLCCDVVRLQRAVAWLEELGEMTLVFQPMMPGRSAFVRPEGFERVPAWHARYDEAMQHALQNRSEEALGILRETIRQFPDCMPLVYQTAAEYENIGAFAEGLPYAEKAFQLLPGQGQAILLARLRLANGQAQAIWDELRTFLRGAPNVVARRILAMAAMEVAPIEAPDCWQEVIELPEATASDRMALALTWHLQHRPQQAAEQAWQIFEQDGASLTSGDLRRCAVLQLHPGYPGANEMVTRIARALLARFENSGDREAGRWYLELRNRLGDPPWLSIPDPERLAEAGVVARLQSSDVLAWLRLQNALQQQVLAGYFRGEVPLEAVTGTLNAPEAWFIAWLIRNDLLLSTPLDLAVRDDVELEGKQVLLGYFELLILDELELLEAFGEALGKQGRLVLFKDVAEAIHEAPAAHLLRERPQEFAQLHALRAFLQKQGQTGEPTDREDGEWAREQGATVVRIVTQSQDELTLAALVRALASTGQLGGKRVEQMLAHLGLYEHAGAESRDLPARVALDSSALTMLWTWNVLQDIHAALGQRWMITPRAWRSLDQAIAQHEIERDARLRADRVHAWLAGMRRRGRVLPSVDRPQADLPPVRDGRAEEIRAWLVQAVSWGEALVQNPQLWLLSADALASEIFTGAAPVPLLSTLQWRQDTGFFHHHERLAPLRKRRLPFAAVALRLAGERREEGLRKLHGLGFSTVYGVEELIALAGEMGGLSQPGAQRILDGIEARSRDRIGWPFARLALAGLYAGVIWKAWCQPTSPHAERVTRALLDRTAGFDSAAWESILASLFRFLWAQAADDPRASFVSTAGRPGSMNLSVDSPAGQLWRCIDAWLGDDVHRRYILSHAAVAVLTQSRAKAVVSTDHVRVAPFLLAIEVLEHETSQAGMLRNCIEILSATWQDRPLENLGIRIGNDERTSRELSVEQLLCMAAEQLAHLQQIDHDGIGVLIPVSLEGTTYPVPGLIPAALLLRASLEVRARWAASFISQEGPDDGRVVEPLLALAARPDDPEAMRTYARLAAEAPWRQVRLDPLMIRLWGVTMTSSFPATIDDLRALLSEPEPLPDDGELEQILSERVTDGAWSRRPDVRHLLDRCGEILGHPMLPFFWRLQPDGSLDQDIDAALARLQHAVDQPAARLACDLLLCCIAGSLPDGVQHRGRVISALEHVLTSAMEPPPDNLAAYEPALLRTAARVVRNLGGARETRRNRLWLIWCLHQWLLRQIEALPTDEQRRLRVHTLCSAWPDDHLSKDEEPDLLDPSRFGRGRLDHRLLAILHVLGSLKPEALQHLISPVTEEILMTLSQREPTPEEHALEALPHPASCLGWYEETPRTVPGLAAIVLASLHAPQASTPDHDSSSSSI